MRKHKRIWPRGTGGPFSPCATMQGLRGLIGSSCCGPVCVHTANVRLYWPRELPPAKPHPYSRSILFFGTRESRESPFTFDRSNANMRPFGPESPARICCLERWAGNPVAIKYSSGNVRAPRSRGDNLFPSQAPKLYWVLEFLINSRSRPISTSSATAMPPDSMTSFQVMPKSLRLTLVLALRPIFSLPRGSRMD